MAPPYPFPPSLPPVPPRLAGQSSKRLQEVRDYRTDFDRAMQPVPGLPAVPTGPYDPPTDPRYWDAYLNLQHGIQQGGHLLDAAGNYPGLGGIYPPVAGAAGTIDPDEIDRIYGSNPGATIGNALGDFGTEFWRGVGDTDLGQGIFEDAAVASGHIPPPPLTATPVAVPLPNPYPGMNPPYSPQPPPTNTPGGYNPDFPIGPGNVSPGAPGMPGYERPFYPPPGMSTPLPRPDLSGWPTLQYPPGNLPPSYPATPPINIPPRATPHPEPTSGRPVWETGFGYGPLGDPRGYGPR
jgi:hypothetical protein